MVEILNDYRHSGNGNGKISSIISGQYRSNACNHLLILQIAHRLTGPFLLPEFSGIRITGQRLDDNGRHGIFFIENEIFIQGIVCSPFL